MLQIHWALTKCQSFSQQPLLSASPGEPLREGSWMFPLSLQFPGCFPPVFPVQVLLLSRISRMNACFPRSSCWQVWPFPSLALSQGCLLSVCITLQVQHGISQLLKYGNTGPALWASLVYVTSLDLRQGPRDMLQAERWWFMAWSEASKTTFQHCHQHPLWLVRARAILPWIS